MVFSVVDFFAMGLHTCTDVTRSALHQLGFLVNVWGATEKSL